MMNLKKVFDMWVEFFTGKCRFWRICAGFRVNFAPCADDAGPFCGTYREFVRVYECKD